MKKYFIIASHGHFAEGLYDSLKIIMGKQENITTLCAYVDDTNIEEQINDIIQKHNGKETIILTDIYGGSVNNIFLKYIHYPNIHLVTDINLPLLIEMVCSQHLPTEKMITNSIQAASHCFRYCRKLDFDSDNDDF